MTSLPLAKLVLDVTRISGRVQRALYLESRTPDEIATIMDRLATAETVAVVRSRTGDQEFDILRLGLEGNRTAVIELRRRWTVARAINLGLALAVIAALLVGAFILGSQQGFAEGFDYQLPTLPEGE